MKVVIVIVIVIALLICCGILYVLSSPPNIQWFTLNSITRKRLNDNIHKNIIDKQVHNWKNFYNPSIIKYGEDMLVLVRLDRSRFFARITTIMVEKISGCDMSNKPVILSIPFNDYIKWLWEAFPFIKIGGFQDPRLFLYQGSVYCLVTMFHKNTTFVHLAKISDNLMAIDNIIKLKPINSSSTIEKNWNPFIPDKGLFITHVQPHTIVHIDMETGYLKLMYKTESPGLKKKYGNHSIRATTRYVETPLGYLAIAHFVVKQLLILKYYYNIFYLVETTPPYQIIKFSDPFRIKTELNNPIQFISGLERVGNELWLAYGDDDKKAYIDVVNMNYVLELTMENDG